MNTSSVYMNEWTIWMNCFRTVFVYYLFFFVQYSKQRSDITYNNTVITILHGFFRASLCVSNNIFWVQQTLLSLNCNHCFYDKIGTVITYIKRR